MSAEPTQPRTHIATSTREDVFIRDKSLCREILGQMSFVELIYFQLLGKTLSPAQLKILDACLVTLMEHGMTPSVLAARLVYGSAPESLQAAVAAGISGVGSVFVGTVEGCGLLLERLVAPGVNVAEEARRIAEEYRANRKPLPGFGHPQHKPDDPRTIRLFELARELGASGAHVSAVQALSEAVDEVYGKHITLNATGAIAALLRDCDVPAEILRGFAIIARCAGLIGHLHEEQHCPTLTAIWSAAEHAVPYAGDVER